MKKFLEVLLDDNGEMHIKAETPVPDLDDPKATKKADTLYKAAMRSLVKAIWQKHDMRASAAIRILSMAEMACDRQPYEHVDQFFFTMIHDFLPHYEQYSNKLKAPYGFKRTEMIKPIIMGGSTLMKMTKLPPCMEFFLDDLPF